MNSERVVTPNAHLTLHYRLAVGSGAQVRDLVTTFGQKPATLQLGCGQLSPGIEARLVGADGSDVAEGEALPPMVKGPMTVTGFIAYAQGWGGLYIRANKLNWKQVHAHPGLGIPNRFGIPDCPERVHWEPEFALQVGAPGAYDYGPERCSWLTHHLTNWMSDRGFLRKATCKIRRHNPEGDLLYVSAKVARKWEENGRKLVEIEQAAHNQDGELSVFGSGVVELPGR